MDIKDIITEARKRKSILVKVIDDTIFFHDTQWMKGVFHVESRTYFDMEGSEITRQKALKELKKQGIPFVLATPSGKGITRIAFM
jgi:hypothetical protein